MKNAMLAICVGLACVVMAAQEAVPAPSKAPAKAPAVTAPWPVWFAFNSVDDVDVVGLRLTCPYGSCDSVTGLDLGLIGSCRYFEGFQINILRNEAIDVLSGLQLGLYNTCGRGDMTGLQVGLFNETRVMSGAQVGLINLAESVQGLQVGLINRAETASGFQIGLVNVIRESQIAFFPIVNIGFDSFPNY